MGDAKKGGTLMMMSPKQYDGTEAAQRHTTPELGHGKTKCEK
jgi:hypothetical protein